MAKHSIPTYPLSNFFWDVRDIQMDESRSVCLVNAVKEKLSSLTRQQILAIRDSALGFVDRCNEELNKFNEQGYREQFNVESRMPLSGFTKNLLVLTSQNDSSKECAHESLRDC